MKGVNMKITCKQAVDFISKKEEHRLSQIKRFALWNHLKSCRLCRSFMAQNKIIAIAAVSREQLHAMTAEEKEAIIKRVLQDSR